jgi:hypothetical protein
MDGGEGMACRAFLHVSRRRWVHREQLRSCAEAWAVYGARHFYEPSRSSIGIPKAAPAVSGGAPQPRHRWHARRSWQQRDHFAINCSALRCGRPRKAFWAATTTYKSERTRAPVMCASEHVPPLRGGQRRLLMTSAPRCMNIPAPAWMPLPSASTCVSILPLAGLFAKAST